MLGIQNIKITVFHPHTNSKTIAVGQLIFRQCKREFIHGYGNFTSNICFTSHSRKAQSLIEIDQTHFHDEIVSWSNGSLPTHSIDSSEKEQSPTAFSVNRWGKTNNTSYFIVLVLER